MAPIRLHLLGRDDAHVLGKVAPNVFDHAVDPRWTREFLDDPRHHLIVALDGDLVVGMTSAIHYVHPDKPPAMWINELGVDEAYRNQGIGRRLIRAMVDHARAIGCTEAWVATEMTNAPARRVYQAAGGRQDKDDAVVYLFTL